MVILVMIVVVIAFFLMCAKYAAAAERREIAGMSPEQLEAHKQRKADAVVERMRKHREQQQARALQQYGSVSAAIICPHCQVKGHVHTKIIKQKKGISGAKTTAALMTVGTSILVTGLSRKEKNMQAHCDNCGSTWML